MKDNFKLESILQPVEPQKNLNLFQNGMIASKERVFFNYDTNQRSSTTIPEKKRIIGGFIMKKVEALEIYDDSKEIATDRVERQQNTNSTPHVNSINNWFEEKKNNEDTQKNKQILTSCYSAQLNKGSTGNMHTISEQFNLLKMDSKEAESTNHRLFSNDKVIRGIYSSSSSSNVLRKQIRNNKTGSTFGFSTSKQISSVNQETTKEEGVNPEIDVQPNYKQLKVIVNNDNYIQEEDTGSQFTSKYLKPIQFKTQKERQISFKEDKDLIAKHEIQDQLKNEQQQQQQQISKNGSINKLNSTLSQGLESSLSSLKQFSTSLSGKLNFISKQEQRLVSSSSIAKMAINEEDIKFQNLQRAETEKFEEFAKLQRQKEQMTELQAQHKKQFVTLDKKQNEISFENERDGELFHNKKSIRFLNLNFLGKQIAFNNKTCLGGLLNKEQQQKQHDPKMYEKFKQFMKDKSLQSLIKLSPNKNTSISQKGNGKQIQQRDSIPFSLQHSKRNQQNLSIRKQVEPYFQSENNSEIEEIKIKDIDVETPNKNEEKKQSFFKKILVQNLKRGQEERGEQLSNRSPSNNFAGENMIQARNVNQNRQLSIDSVIIGYMSASKLRKNQTRNMRSSANKTDKIQKIDDLNDETNQKAKNELSVQIIRNSDKKEPQPYNNNHNINNNYNNNNSNSNKNSQNNSNSYYNNINNNLQSSQQQFDQLEELIIHFEGAKRYLQLLFEVDFCMKLILSETELSSEQFIESFFIFLYNQIITRVSISQSYKWNQLINFNSIELEQQQQKKQPIQMQSLDISMSNSSQQLILDVLKNGLLLEGGKQELVQFFINFIKSRMLKKLKQKNLISELGGQVNLRKIFIIALELMNNKCHCNILKGLSQDQQGQIVERLVQIIIIQEEEDFNNNSNNNQEYIQNLIPFQLSFIQLFLLKIQIQFAAENLGFSCKTSFKLIERIEKLRCLISKEDFSRKSDVLNNFQFKRTSASLIDKYVSLKNNSPAERILFMDCFCLFLRGEVSLNGFTQFVQEKSTFINSTDIWQNIQLFADQIFRDESMKSIRSQLQYQLTLLSFINEHFNNQQSIQQQYLKEKQSQQKQQLDNTDRENCQFGSFCSSITESNQIKPFSNNHHSYSLQLNKIQNHSSSTDRLRVHLKSNKIYQIQQLPLIFQTPTLRSIFWKSLQCYIEEDHHKKQKLRFPHLHLHKQQITNFSFQDDNQQIQNHLDYHHTQFQSLSYHTAILKYILDFSISPFQVFSLFDVEAAFSQYQITKEIIENWLILIDSSMTLGGLSKKEIDKERTFLQQCWNVCLNPKLL